MQSNAVVAGSVCVLMLFGGTMGYVKKKSKASLIAGGLFSFAYAVLAKLMVDNNNNKQLNTYGALLSGFLGFFMGYRAIKTGFARIPTVVAVIGLGSAGMFIMI